MFFRRFIAVFAWFARRTSGLRGVRAIVGGVSLCLAFGSVSPAAAQTWLYMYLYSSPNSIPVNGRAVLGFLVNRTGGAITLTNLTVNATLPAGVSVVSVDSNDCGGTVTAVGTSIGLSGGSFNGSRVFCAFSVTVTSATVGNFLIMTGNITSNETSPGSAGNTSLTVTPPLSTTTVTSSLNPSGHGRAVTFTATVAGTSGTPPTGTVTFKDGATTLGSVALSAGGAAAVTTSALSVGSHAITAEYGGDASNHLSTSSALAQTVSQVSATTALVSSANPGVAGQALTFTATVTGSAAGTPSGTVTFMDGGTALGSAALAGGVASFTTSALAVGAHSITASYGGDVNNTASTSAALAQAVNVSADSIKLRQLQAMATRVAAQASGQAISGAVDTAIADGFSDGGELIAPSGSGLRINFAAERPSAVSEGASPIDAAQGVKQQARSRTDDAFAALGYDRANGTKAPPRIVAAKEWLPWADVKYSGIDRGGSTPGATAALLYGSHVNALFGLTRKLAPSFLVGAFGGYETFDYTSQELNGKLSGQGWTVGSYLGWKLAPSLRFDAAVAYSGIGYDGVAGRAQGNFDGRRWFVSSGLTGTSKAYGLEIEPSAKIYALWERENAYTDSLGTYQADRNFSTGRASGGGKVIYPFAGSERLMLAPYAGLYGDYYFTRDDAEAIIVAGAVPLASSPLLDGWSARAVGGVTAKFAEGGTLALGGELGGIGSDVQIWTFRARAGVPF